MKKAVRLMLSLFSALSLMFLSCSTDSSSGGGDPEFDVIICDTKKTSEEKLTWERDAGKDVYICVTSENYLKDLEIESITDEELNSIEFTVDDSFVGTFKLYKVWLKGASSTPGTYNYTLAVCCKSNAKKKMMIDFTVKITGSSSGSETESAVPVIKTQPVAGKEYYESGETIDALTVKAEISKGNVTYQWFKDGNIISGAIEATYTPTGKGQYYVVVSNDSDSTKSVKSNIVSIVVLAADELVPPAINKNLEDSISYDKSSMIEKIEIEATAKQGTVKYKWYNKDTGVITGATSASYKPEAFGSYYCELWAVDGEKESQKITSNTITIKESEIVIEINGLSKEAYLGTELKVEPVINVDTSEISYKWYKTSGTVSSDNDEPMSGATSASYIPTEAGNYTCEVSVVSVTGKTKTSRNGGVCTVKEYEEGDAKTPVINTQPVCVTCTEGDKITLTVNAESPDNGKLSYQWKKDGQSISGATDATYEKANATTDDSGSYTVEITNTVSTGKTATIIFAAAQVTVSSSTGSGSGNIDFNN